MQILLCAATPFEVEPVSQWLQQATGKKVDVLYTGVGLLNATYALTKAVALHKPHLILQAGLAGGFDDTVPLGTTMVVLRETVGDMGVLENATFTPVFDMGLINANEAPWKARMLENPHTDLIKACELVLADGVTVNEISTNEDRISFYKNGLGATVESMEGAALHFVALQEDIPFLQIRTLSNYVGERNKKAWMLQEGVQNLNSELQRILQKLWNQ